MMRTQQHDDTARQPDDSWCNLFLMDTGLFICQALYCSMVFLVNKTDETLPKTGVVKLVQI